MSWIVTVIGWYFMLLVIGILFLPLTTFLFGRWFDRGWATSKTIGILLLSYIIFIGANTQIVPFTQLSLILILGAVGLLDIVLIKKSSSVQNALKNPPLGIWIFEEIICIASLFFLSFVRGQEPSVRGLEKFMDFGFMNSILRSKFFPPLDMWLSADAQKPAGYPINYYYFGHLTGSVLIKLSGVLPSIGYNLILASILAQSMTISFSLCTQLATQFFLFTKNRGKLFFPFVIGLLGSFIINLGGNLHTIYLFTSGYPNESPIPFWKILGSFSPDKYWYPNATRFIPFTIHEFPSYSYVVADLHGHVFDIPFVLITLSFLATFFIAFQDKKIKSDSRILSWFLPAVFIGFMIAVHYMTNAFDGPIYLLLATIIFFLIYRLSVRFLLSVATTLSTFLLASFPFSVWFSPFASGIGVNCSPEFLTNIKKIGPFLFEKGNCQISPNWMLIVLWGFFWGCALIFLCIKLFSKEKKMLPVEIFCGILFGFGTILIIIPEFFYIKDIYPAHFRANTMFKLGYQAFIMMGISSSCVFILIKQIAFRPVSIGLKCIYFILFLLIFLYPFYSFPSYYGNLTRKVELDGSNWLTTSFPQNLEIINFIQKEIKGQPIILEAQGDSYTDFNHISAYTGLPTVAGWWVHEWLWRGSADVVGKRIPDIEYIYTSSNSAQTQTLLKKYHVSYVVVASQEREKYKKLTPEIEKKFSQFGKKIFTTKNGLGALYQVEKNGDLTN